MGLFYLLQFIKDRIPVMIAIQQDSIKSAQAWQDIETQVSMNGKNLTKSLSIGFMMKPGQQVNHMKISLVFRAVAQQIGGVVAIECANLNDGFGLAGFQNWLDDIAPKYAHAAYCLNLLGERRSLGLVFRRLDRSVRNFRRFGLASQG